MKIPRLCLLGICIALFSYTSLIGDDFMFSLGSGRNVLWNTGGIWRDADDNLYGTGINPGSLDTILALDYDASQGAGIPNLYLNNNRTIARLEASNLSNTRIWSGNFNNPAANSHHTLTINEAFHMKAGNYYFRSLAGGKLSVITPVFELGSMDYPTSRARVELASSTAGQGNIEFRSEQTIFRGYNPQFAVGSSFDTVNGRVNLGHVLFDMTPGVEDNVNNYPGITLAHQDQVLHVASLRGGGNETRGAIKGVGTVRIDPAVSTQPLPSVANFNRLIQEGIRIEKLGSSIQTFSYANTYSGGTSIQGGVLNVSNASGSGLGSGQVDVHAGAILSGGGRVALSGGNTIRVQAGGSLAPGESNRQLVDTGEETLEYKTLTIHATSLEMEQDSKFAFRLGANGVSDQVEFTGYAPGMIDLDSSGIQVDIYGDIEVGDYVLFTFADSTGRVASGLGDGLIAGSGFGDYVARFYYDGPLRGGIGSITLSLSEIPEPETVALVMTALLALGLGYVRRKASQ